MQTAPIPSLPEPYQTFARAVRGASSPAAKAAAIRNYYRNLGYSVVEPTEGYARDLFALWTSRVAPPLPSSH